MDQKYFTIGMAGHIDHGKTSLTKALTHIDTDRLKEEKERNISIELGFAPLYLHNQSFQVSIVDVPGHEKFIRQMIAGVSGIDLVILTVAADEGVMPQTKEHMDILNLLHVHEAIIVITKIDRVDEEMIALVKDDILAHIHQTSFEDAPIKMVDSYSERGIEDLTCTIENHLEKIPDRKDIGTFRLPIDQVFTVKGQGTVVRGTVYNGFVREEDTLTVLPSGLTCRARQIQIHKEGVRNARAGQRAAINVGGVDRQELKRGDVLVGDDRYTVTSTIDVTLKFVEQVRTPLKQRNFVKVHIGTSEVMGNIVFFDRNEVIQGNEEILCQIRLDESIVAQRGDRFIIRRPSPMETLGGGWVIDPHGVKYRFGMETIEMLEKKREGTPMERVLDVLDQHTVLKEDDIIQLAGLSGGELSELFESQLQEVAYIRSYYILKRDLEQVEQSILDYLTQYHELYPMHAGANKPDVMNTVNIPDTIFDVLLEQWETEQKIVRNGPFISLSSFQPHLPNQWEKRVEQALHSLKGDALKPHPFKEYVFQEGVPQDIIEELEKFLVSQNWVIRMDDKHVIDQKTFNEAIEVLKKNTDNTFTLKEAKEIWGVSRKYLIPLLEMLDDYGLTKRIEDKRQWV